MTPELRDLFAMHFAAALVRQERYSMEFIAGRAYDLADAMLAERERRLDVEEAEIEPHAERFSAGGLLDEPMPLFERDDLDPSWLEPPYDPAWDVEKWRIDSARSDADVRPGLARTYAPDDVPGRAAGNGGKR